MTNFKHLTLEDRIFIQEQLQMKSSFKSIALSLHKDCSTISKEIRNHLTYEKSGCLGSCFNDCVHRSSCTYHNLCTRIKCNKSCRSCNLCMSVCSMYSREICNKLLKPPYVCNSCSIRRSCTLEKRLYRAKYAQEEYRETLESTRQVLHLTQEEISQVNDALSAPILLGQSLYHAAKNNATLVNVSLNTLYNYTDLGLFSFKNIDLPRKVRYTKRTTKRRHKVESSCRQGRTEKDFKTFIEEHDSLPIVEMDSVEGMKGGKVLLTLYFRESKLMLAFLRDRNDSASVISIFDHLEKALGLTIFKRLFPIVLTDNGTEFSSPTKLETSIYGTQRCKIFYCDPGASWQKGGVEKNHEFIRYLIPKGKSFDFLNQALVNEMMNHINSYTRESLGDKAPMDVFTFLYDDDSIKKAFHLERIESNKVTLNSSLFNK